MITQFVQCHHLVGLAENAPSAGLLCMPALISTAHRAGVIAQKKGAH
ncbi:hypothetical protein PRUB_a5337 [Pseudoalteromonas rubra]|uniref:Uncharacterized protein n=1 Tax=Pseudoalteromonas rubra TaxID=43658 RepID=A0A8T0CAD7_9GAMM|nr:hypothetical protein PRUB_a5337 [Pseudoalteromonas rubra]